MPELVVGREAELASLRDFVASVSDGASALVLQGEAGVGKTTIWRAGVAGAEERGLRVLQALPAESETALSFSGIGDLLDPVLDEALAPLPAGQKRALSRALVLDDDEGGPPPDPHAVGVAFLNALRTLAEERPIIVAVDDVQWLDPASSGALAYAARRLRAEHVGLLLSRRTGLESTLLDELRHSLSAERFSDVDVGPLDLSALHHVVQDHLGIVLPRPQLAEVHAASGGNPFYALEIVRMLQRRGISVEAGQPLPVPESLHDLVHGRVLALPPESRDFLLAAAALSHPTVGLVEAATDVTREAGLAPALEARVIELDGDRIRFTHPLLAAGAYEAADQPRRSKIHARLAELVDDPEARGRHLAASVTEPDEAVAAALDEAADRAWARGAPGAAALLLERARELTPPDGGDDAYRRAVDAAYLHFESGDSRKAEEQLQDLIGQLAPGVVRARALMRLARVWAYQTHAEAAELFRQAVEEAEGDREVLVIAHEGVAVCLLRLREQLAEALEHAERAAALALELGDDALAAESLGNQLLLETYLGRKTAGATLTRVIALQDAASDRRVLAQPLSMAAVHWSWTDELERARDALLEMLQRSRELGDESAPPYLLVLLGQVECTFGELETARLHALAGQEASEQSGQRAPLAYNLALESLVEAQLGRVELARAAALRALEFVPETGSRSGELVATGALGHLDLVLGDSEAAAARLQSIVAFARREAIVEPGAIPFVIDHIEAVVELGRNDDAVELLDWYEGNARRLERASALANCRRCRGLLAASEGRLDDAIAAYEEAIEAHARVERPLDRGRTLLALGATQRRMKRRREARETLEESLAVFERIGAALWAERARAELRRISGRAASPGALTPAEERVAALVAEGKTNREVAAALFLSQRTVEGHLSHVFGKLGISHRTELGRALASRQTQGVAAPNPGDSPVSAAPAAP